MASGPLRRWVVAVKSEPNTDDTQDAGDPLGIDLSGGSWWRGVTLQQSGPVVRHVARQAPEDPEEESARARRRREDQRCTAGLRNPASALRRLPGVVARTREVFCALRRARAVNPDLCGLHRAGGAAPSREPPTDRSLAALRRVVAFSLNVSAQDAETRHPAAPWRYELFRAVAGLLADSDQSVPNWLQHGAPMGLAVPIAAGGHFPLLAEPAGVHYDDLSPLVAHDVNHPSLHSRFEGDEEAAGWALVRKAVEDGYGELFSDSVAAETALGGVIHPAPLGTVSKQRTDGSWKHRLIQDLRANRVNAAVELPERMVLPRPVELASDLARMAAARDPDDVIMVGIVDFADAFMSIPLDPAERRFNCASLPQDLRRERAALHTREPEAGRVIVWRVLGFGGRPNPLVFGRVTSVLMRLVQAILTARRDLQGPSGDELAQEEDCAFLDAAARCHLYVDDAAAAFCGSREEVEEAFDLLLLMWLVMGAPIAWPKVGLEAVTSGAPTRWIGVEFSIAQGSARMRLPADFVEELLAQLRAARARDGRISDTEAAQLVGRAGRVAFVVPAAGPFAAALRVALSSARQTASTQRRADQRGSHSFRRFAVAASWFEALLTEAPVSVDGRLPLERVIAAEVPQDLVAGQCDAIVFDASPWGGGAVLFEGRRPREWIAADWSIDLCRTLQVERGSSAHLAFFEALTALAAVVAWCAGGRRSSIAVVGDNIAALTVAVSQRGRGDLGRICRELALVQARLGLTIAVGHLATELNTWADALSRLTAPEPSEVPAGLRKVPRLQWPSVDQLFRVLPRGVSPGRAVERPCGQGRD